MATCPLSSPVGTDPGSTSAGAADSTERTETARGPPPSCRRFLPLHESLSGLASGGPIQGFGEPARLYRVLLVACEKDRSRSPRATAHFSRHLIGITPGWFRKRGRGPRLGPGWIRSRLVFVEVVVVPRLHRPAHDRTTGAGSARPRASGRSQRRGRSSPDPLASDIALSRSRRAVAKRVVIADGRPIPERREWFDLRRCRRLAFVKLHERLGVQARLPVNTCSGYHLGRGLF